MGSIKITCEGKTEVVKLPTIPIGSGGSGEVDLSDYIKNTDRDNFVKGGVTENSITLTDEEKANALEWLGAAQRPKGPLGGYILIGTKYQSTEPNYFSTFPKSTSINGIPMYDDNGCIYTQTPQEDKACANKKYVDDAVGTYRYHIKLHILNGMIPVYVEFDTFSQNADLFSNNNTAIENYNILHSLYASEKIPVVYKISFDGYNIEGAVSLTFNASSNGRNELMGCGFDIDKVTHQYIIDGFSSSEISTFEFTRFEQ